MYIGKGTGKRAFREKNKFDVVILCDGLTEDRAWELEASLIQSYRQAGHKLLNKTDGGTGGFTEINSSPDLRKRRDLSFRTRYQTEGPTSKEKDRIANFQRIGQEARIGSQHTEETKQLIGLKKNKSVMTPNGMFTSRLQASLHYGVTPKTISDWMNKDKGFHYV